MNASQNKTSYEDKKNSNNQHCTIDETIDEVFPIPSWNILVLSHVGGVNVICIPNDIKIDNLRIPSHIKQVNVHMQEYVLIRITNE